MTAVDDQRIRLTRLNSLLLAQRPASGRTLAEVVGWFGAMQGQDFASLLWSLGLRTGLTRDQVQAGFTSGAILRTWPMRGTLHVVPGADARWMLEHLGTRALRAAAPRRASLGLTERIAEQAVEVLAQALAGGRAMTRTECVAVLGQAGIPAVGSQAYHLLWFASQRGVTCVGPPRGSQQTFVLLDDFAPPAVRLDRPAALATIAERFVRSHGPVTAHDLARWADLTVTDARAGLSAAQGIICQPVAGRNLYLTEGQLDHLSAASPEPEAGRSGGGVPALALPGFDELVLGYRDRSAQLDPAAEQHVVPGGNGMFAPTLVLDGRVVGLWRRRELARTVQIEATPLTRIRVGDRRRLDQALEGYAQFIGKDARISWSDQAG